MNYFLLNRIKLRILGSKLSILLILLTVLFGLFSQASTQKALCSDIFTFKNKIEDRQKLLSAPTQFLKNELIDSLIIDGRMIFKGSHEYVPGTEFLASNESDWTLTPFDHKDTDVLIGYGTNSAWEIAADKNIKQLIIADWSPNPLIAQAYIWTPFWKIAKSPTELILLMGGIVPTEKLLNLDFDEAVQLAGWTLKKQTPERAKDLDQFFNMLIQNSEVSDLEIRVIQSYFKSFLTHTYRVTDIGPFQQIADPQAHNIIDLIYFRYDKKSAAKYNVRTQFTNEIYQQQSVFHNLEMFHKVKKLYTSGSVKYALTSVDNLQFYQTVKSEYAKLYPSSQVRYSMSITNIYECSYAGLTFFDLRDMLRETSLTFDANISNPFVVFRTTNYTSPHGFYRYNITTPSAVLKEDEVDSKASHIPNYMLKGAGGF